VLGKGVLEYATMAEIDLEFVLPMTIVCPALNGSVFETFLSRGNVSGGEALAYII